MPESISACNLCGHNQVVVQPQKARFLGLPAGLGIVTCLRCGLTFMSPRPTQAEYARYYNDEPVYSSDAYSARAESRTEFYLRRIPQLEAALGRKGKLLEIGCGTGHFLNLAQAAGWQVCGVDISAPFCRYAVEMFGLDVRQANSLEQCNFSDESFDLIYSTHVFEHLVDPMHAFIQVRRILKHDGILVIEVPQQFISLRDRIRGWALTVSGQAGEGKLYKRPISSTHHVFFFTVATLSAMATRAGFQIRKIRTYERHHKQVIGDGALGGYWLAETMHRLGSIFRLGPIVLLFAQKSVH